MKEHTLKTPISFEGKGLHTGQYAIVQIKPAPEDHGIQFCRTDLEGQPLIKADASNVVNTQRCTTLGQKEATVKTVEHLLAALLGTGVDNALVEINGPEIPILDGSAKEITAKILEVGLVEQKQDREYFVVEAPITVKDEQTGAELTVLPADDFEITALIDFDSPVLHKQYATIKGFDNFSTEIADSRTFTFLHEIEELLDAGLIKGGDLDNAVVFVNEVLENGKLSNLAQKLNKTDMRVEREGILNTTALRHPNEPARHKLLDIIGDLALVGKSIKGHIIAKKPGHTINNKLAKELKRVFKLQQKTADVPKYDPTIAPIFDINDISNKLQHRFPFLLIDKIIELSDKHVVGVKNVTANEPYFPGHFPNNPVMPGVLQVEAMAQTGGLLVMEHIDNPHDYDTYFLRIDKARFRQKVVPGDTILFKLELISPVRRGLCEMRGRAYVGNKLVAEAELLAQIIKRK